MKAKKKKKLSRQRIWQLKRIEAGGCMYCRQPAFKRGYCKLHYDKKQSRTLRWHYRRQNKKKKLQGDASQTTGSQPVTPEAFV